MKKIKRSYIIILLTSILALIPNISLGWCNTVTFDKEVTAAQIVLENGQVLHDIRINKKKVDQKKLTSNDYKLLNLTILFDTKILSATANSRTGVASVINPNANTTEENNYISTIKSLIDSLYNIYSTNKKMENKIKLHFIPFNSGAGENYTTQEENDIVKERDDNYSNFLSKLKNLSSNTSRPLNKALELAQEKFEDNNQGELNENLLQYLLVITKNIPNENVRKSSKALIEELPGKNMIAGKIIQIDGSTGLVGNISISITSIDNINTFKQNVKNQLSEDIKKELIKAEQIFPANNYKNVQITSNSITFICNDDILYGAKLRVEYEMKLKIGALYAADKNTIEVRSQTINDFYSPRFSFSEDEKLITEPKKTNKNYGWVKTKETRLKDKKTKGKKEECVSTNYYDKSNNVKLVLTSTLSGSKDEDYEFTNEVDCSTSYKVADRNFWNSFTDSAMRVLIIPPTGEDKSPKIELYYISLNSIILFTATLTIIAIRKKRKEK